MVRSRIGARLDSKIPSSFRITVLVCRLPNLRLISPSRDRLKMLFISLGTPGSAKIIVLSASRRTPGAVPALFLSGVAPRGSRAIFILAEVSFKSSLPIST